MLPEEVREALPRGLADELIPLFWSGWSAGARAEREGLGVVLGRIEERLVGLRTPTAAPSQGMGKAQPPLNLAAITREPTGPRPHPEEEDGAVVEAPAQQQPGDEDDPIGVSGYRVSIEREMIAWAQRRSTDPEKAARIVLQVLKEKTKPSAGGAPPGSAGAIIERVLQNREILKGAADGFLEKNLGDGAALSDGEATAAAGRMGMEKAAKAIIGGGE